MNMIQAQTLWLKLILWLQAWSEYNKCRNKKKTKNVQNDCWLLSDADWVTKIIPIWQTNIWLLLTILVWQTGHHLSWLWSHSGPPCSPPVISPPQLHSWALIAKHWGRWRWPPAGCRSPRPGCRRRCSPWRSWWPPGQLTCRWGKLRGQCCRRRGGSAPQRTEPQAGDISQ